MPVFQLFVVALFVSLNALSAPQVIPANRESIKILHVGPSVQTPLAVGEKSVATALEEKMNADCSQCFQVTGLQLQQGWVVANYLFLRDHLKDYSAELVVYFESGTFLTSDLAEALAYDHDDDGFPTHVKPPETFSCCEWLLTRLPSEKRFQLDHQFRFFQQMRKSCDGVCVNLEKPLAPVMDLFLKMEVLARRQNKRFFVMLAPLPMSTHLLFSDSVFMSVLYHHLGPTLPKSYTLPFFVGKGFRVATLSENLRNLYSRPKIIKKNQRFLNNDGVNLLTDAMADTIRTIRSQTERRVLQ